MTSSNKGIDNKLVMEIKGEAGINNYGATKANEQGISFTIITIIGLSIKLVKGMTIIFPKHVDEDVNEKVIVLG